MSRIRAIIFDVDGTLTDGSIYIGASGELMKRFDVKDGYAIHSMMPKNDLIPIIITGRNSKIVEVRANELGIDHVYQGVPNKLKKMIEVASNLGIMNEEIAYIGDDINDLECIQQVGFSACPNDAVDEVKRNCDYVCNSKGGYGAAREFIEYICNNNKNIM